MLLTLLQGFADPQNDPVALLAALVAEVRPQRVDDTVSATANLTALTSALRNDPDVRRGLREALFALFRSRRQIRLYVASGILPNSGFFSETRRRLSRTLLPDVVDPNDLKDVLIRLFPKRSDERWVNAVADETWMDLLAALGFEEAEWSRELPVGMRQMLEALTVLSYHIADIGLDPELARIDPDIERFASPFIAQNRELLSYVDQYRAWWTDHQAHIDDEKHLLVLLDQCREIIERIRRRTAQEGTSLILTYRLHRLRQHIRRCEQLVNVLATIHRERISRESLRPIVALFKTLVRAECHRNDLRDYWRQNLELLALRVTEATSEHGEHYITTTRAEYLALCRSAIGAGFIIAFMALCKILLGKLALAPLNEALAFSLNYALGFVLIHMLHFTVATKQPAMTASAIAASIGEAQGKVRDLEALTTLIACTLRSQFVAISGNVAIALPLAALLAWGGATLGGRPFIDEGKALALLGDHHPLASGTLLFAAFAGVCLFLSGLIAGYYDNFSAYHRIRERLLQLRWPRLVLGAAQHERLATYLGEHLGALAGNFFFGFLLGGTWAVGMLFGLPIDIRHVAFSSAFLGFALGSIDFLPNWPLFAWAAAGVVGVGLINLAVSFALALWVALRARQVTFAQSRALAKSLLQRLLRQPRQFLLPPREPAATAATANTPATPD